MNQLPVECVVTTCEFTLQYAPRHLSLALPLQHHPKLKDKNSPTSE